MTDVGLDENFDAGLILAAEEWPLDAFDAHHSFSNYDESIIRKLSAHGPVLIRGGRGSGKSALLIAAHKRMTEKKNVFSVYLSLRYLPLLQTDGEEYIKHFCEILSNKIQSDLKINNSSIDFVRAESLTELQRGLADLSAAVGQRIILLFDDAAHIGREKPLEVFFDLFRTLSSNTISCKASIYPGVTKFGIRFDIFNDATVIDVARLETSEVENHFVDVLRRRYPSLAHKDIYSDRLTLEMFSGILARALVGNMRAYILACNRFVDKEKISIPDLNACLLNMATDYYWPLMEEVAPKLGQYEPFIDTATDIFTQLIDVASKSNPSRQSPSERVLVHRAMVTKFAKPFEILEYLGFIGKRDASRALKSGGRGPVYAVNLCSLLEQVQGKRMTLEMMNDWRSARTDATEIHVNSDVFGNIALPSLPSVDTLGILEKPLKWIEKGNMYPYGLTPGKISLFVAAGYETIGELVGADDAKLIAIDGIGDKTVKKARDLAYQAVWM
ncbi:ATP-binding protein [Aurantimonas sp. Leaf443]|uniref:ATP-binding protein n=1 Tax=Aurantimonas sp. Leaf443 TaxID=1736378 RepID=UPI000A730888|nr:ATP-binding protein [Aurantimonas sp. Leaf443]